MRAHLQAAFAIRSYVNADVLPSFHGDYFSPRMNLSLKDMVISFPCSLNLYECCSLCKILTVYITVYFTNTFVFFTSWLCFVSLCCVSIVLDMDFISLNLFPDNQYLHFNRFKLSGEENKQLLQDTFLVYLAFSWRRLCLSLRLWH